MEQNITYSKIIKELKKFQEQSPFLKSFGQGNLVDFGKDDENETPLYPMMFVIPTSVEYNDNTTTYGLQVIIADRLNDDLEGNEYIISDCQQIGRDLIGQIKRGFLFDVMDITYPVISQPFQERFNDVLAGISMDLSVEVDDGNDVCLLPDNTDLTPEKLSVVRFDDISQGSFLGEYSLLGNGYKENLGGIILNEDFMGNSYAVFGKDTNITGLPRHYLAWDQSTNDFKFMEFRTGGPVVYGYEIPEIIDEAHRYRAQEGLWKDTGNDYVEFNYL